MSTLTKAKTIDDYRQLGEKLDLLFADKIIPQNTRTKGNWKCLRCGYKFSQRFDVLQATKSTGCKKCSFKIYGESKRIGREAYEALAQTKRLKLTGTADVSTTQRTTWKCMDCGKEYFRSYVVISSLVNGCNSCTKLRRLSEALGEILAKYGARPAGRLPKDLKDSIKWFCAKGHSPITSIDNIKQGRFCKQCGQAATTAALCLKFEDYELLGEQRGYPFIGPAPKKSTVQTKWDCVIHGVFKRSYVEMKDKHNCPKCRSRISSERQRTPENKYIQAGEKFGYPYLGPHPENQHEDTYWHCEVHGRFPLTYKNLLYGHGCYRCGRESCADKQRATAPEYHSLADDNLCTWIGKTVPLKAHVKTLFQCFWGHQFPSTYAKLWSQRAENMEAGLSACTKCSALSRISRPEAILFARLKGLGRRSQQHRAGRWKIDILVSTKGMRIAIEYDGWYHHQNQLTQDARRRKSLRDLGFAILRIKGNQLVPTREQLEKAINTITTGRRKWVEIRMPDWGIPATKKE